MLLLMVMFLNTHGEPYRTTYMEMKVGASVKDQSL